MEYENICLVGYTGFVGSNIYASGKEYIKGKYNSKNIKDAYGTNPDLLIYAGLRAEKYLANNEPEKDMELIKEAERNIEAINPKRLVLISTVDVLKNPNRLDEDASVETAGLHPYGYNRYMLECWVREKYEDSLIIRLPGLFGINIKKNFIYDYININPFMLKADKFQELSEKEKSFNDGKLLLEECYELLDNGFFRLLEVDSCKKKLLKERFKQLGFSALNFTDSRAIYQFYNLKNLWADINIALDNDIRLWHPATEPVSASEVYKYLQGQEFINEIVDNPVMYDFRTKYSDVFGGDNGYIANKKTVLHEIKEFVDETCNI